MNQVTVKADSSGSPRSYQVDEVHRARDPLGLRAVHVPTPTSPPLGEIGFETFHHVMRWITRARPKTDRIACPWLIRRFIDPDAEISYLPPDEVLETARADEGAHSFDAPGADYTHRGDLCTFEVLIQEFDLGDDQALQRLAKIVHAADISGALDTDPLGPGLLAIGEGGLDVEADDQTLLERGMFVYDALYAWCQRQQENGNPGRTRIRS